MSMLIQPGRFGAAAAMGTVVLLIGANGTDGSTTFVDESPLARTLTANGTAQIDTAQAKFGVSSLLSAAATGNYVSAAHATELNPGSGAFTIEGWVRLSGTGTTQEFASKFTSSGNRAFQAYVFEFGTTGTISIYLYSSNTLVGSVSSATTLSTGQWYHICFERNSSNLVRIYRDGVMLASGTLAGDMSDTSIFKVGSRLNGWIDEFRFTKGAARYDNSAGFTVPTSAFPR